MAGDYLPLVPLGVGVGIGIGIEFNCVKSSFSCPNSFSRPVDTDSDTDTDTEVAPPSFDKLPDQTCPYFSGALRLT